jgi:tetratricopeptide (TPR) repeat protein
MQCHSSRKYDSPQHHFHKIGSAGSLCVNCHMPARTYMIVDRRRDHSIRLPRPDLSVKLGVPNACNNYHVDKSAQWASDLIGKWYGHAPQGFPRFGEVLDAGLLGSPGLEQSLGQLVIDRDQPAIARATALSMLEVHAPLTNAAPIRDAAGDESALVRRAVARAVSNSDPNASVSIIAPLVSDPVRAVRIEAAEVLAGAPTAMLPDVAIALARASDEYVAAQHLNADRPEAHLNLASLFAREKNLNAAEGELRTSLSLDPSFAPAAINLADLYRELGRETESEAVLRQALQRSPDDASLLYTLALSLVRQQQNAKALELFAQAARADAANARYSYGYAIALDDAGHTAAAIETLERTVKTHPYDRDSLAALVTFCDQAGDSAKSLIYAQRLEQLNPENASTRRMRNLPGTRPHR